MDFGKIPHLGLVSALCAAGFGRSGSCGDEEVKFSQLMKAQSWSIGTLLGTLWSEFIVRQGVFLSFRNQYLFRALLESTIRYQMKGH